MGASPLRLMASIAAVGSGEKEFMMGSCTVAFVYPLGKREPTAPSAGNEWTIFSPIGSQVNMMSMVKLRQVEVEDCWWGSGAPSFAFPICSLAL